MSGICGWIRISLSGKKGKCQTIRFKIHCQNYYCNTSLKSTTIVNELNVFLLVIDLKRGIRGFSVLIGHFFHLHGFAFHKVFVLGIRERFSVLGSHINRLAQIICCREELFLLFYRKLVTYTRNSPVMVIYAWSGQPNQCCRCRPCRKQDGFQRRW